MQRRFLVLLGVVSALLFLPPMVLAAEMIVFENVRVLTMTEAGTLPSATVVVSDGSITSVGEAPADLPDDAVRIDGGGKTLMPGLADMHVHYFSANEGPMFLANGVTTVRNLWGTAQTFALDATNKAGTTAGPHIYTSGPLMDGPNPIWGEGSVKITEPEQVVGAVESQRAVGFKAIKLYEGLTPEIYRAAVAAARERNMQVWTHTPEDMTVEEVINLEVDSIEHFEDVSDFVYEATGDDDDAGYFERWANADPGRMQAIAELSAEKGVWHSPTYAVIAKRYEYGAEPDAFFDLPESGYVGPFLADWWRGSASRMTPYDDVKIAAAERQRELIKTLYDAGASLLIGTDTPNPFVLPGFAIHDELAAFVDAGLPVLDVLRIATADAARFLREDGQWGVIKAGARADLVLLDGDPLVDLATLREPAGVMVNGLWYDEDRLAFELAAAKERLAQPAPEAGE